MFEGIGSFRNMGTLNTYLQQKKLRFAANYKVKTGQSLADVAKAIRSGVADSLMASTRKADDEASRQRVSLIKQKLMSGKKISSTEIEYLRERDPSLYRKAKKAEEYREDLKARLKSCKTRQEARMAVAQAMIKASAEASADLAAAKAMAGGNAAGVSGMGGAQTFGDGVSTEESAMPVAGSTSEGIPANGEASLPEGASFAAHAGMEGANGTAEAQNTAAAEEVDPTSENAPESQEQKGASLLQALANDAQGDMTPDSILEKFIMIVSALQDEWATFSTSREFKDLPEDIKEEAERKARGEKKPRQPKVEAPGRRVLEMLSAYKNTQINMKEFELALARRSVRHNDVQKERP